MSQRHSLQQCSAVQRSAGVSAADFARTGTCAASWCPLARTRRATRRSRQRPAHARATSERSRPSSKRRNDTHVLPYGVLNRQRVQRFRRQRLRRRRPACRRQHPEHASGDARRDALHKVGQRARPFFGGGLKHRASVRAAALRSGSGLQGALRQRMRRLPLLGNAPWRAQVYAVRL